MEEKSPSFADVTLGDYLDMLRRRKGIIIQTFLLVLMIGTVVTLLSKPVFRASARILVEGKNFVVTTNDPKDPISTILTPDQSRDVATQIEIMQGYAVLKQVYEAAHVPIGEVKLDVKQWGSTDVVDLSVDSNKAEYAEKFAAALPKVYQEFLTGNRSDELHKALDFAQSNLTKERDTLNSSNLKLVELRKKTGIFSILVERTNDLAEKNAADTALQAASAQLASAQTKLAALKRADSSETGITQAATQVTNPAIAALNTRIADLKTEKQSLLILFKESNVKVQQVDKQITDLEARLKKEPPMVSSLSKSPNTLKAQMHQQIVDLTNQVAAMQTEVQSARLRQAAANKKLMALGTVEPQQEALENLVESSKANVARLESTVADLNLKISIQHNPVRVLAAAGQAIQVEPKKMTNIIFSAFVGLLFGFGLALLMEFLDDRVSNTEEAQRLIAAPTLGYIPVIDDPNVRLLASKSERKSGGYGSYGGNTVLESYRLLRTNLQFSNVDRPISSLMVTSALPGEGKSITAVNLATAFAMAGRRVLLVDADLRRPSLHTKLAVAKHPGLTNVLLGTTSIAEAVQETSVNNLKILTSGLLPPNPAELFGSNAMLCLHQDLQALADIVIWDTPPVLAAADAQVLSANVDGVLFVLQHGMTKKSAFRHATQVLKQARANILGIVFNRIDPQGKRDEHYYSYYQYYQSYTTDGPERQAKMETRKQFEALVANGAGGGLHPANGNGNGNGARHGAPAPNADAPDELDEEAGLIEVDEDDADGLDGSAVVAANATPQNPMERTVPLPSSKSKRGPGPDRK